MPSHSLVQRRQNALRVVVVDRDSGVDPDGPLILPGSVAELKKYDKALNDGNLKYVELKKTLAEAIIKKLKPFQKKRAELVKDPDKIWQSLEAGAKRARPIAQQTLSEVKQKMGLIK